MKWISENLSSSSIHTALTIHSFLPKSKVPVRRGHSLFTEQEKPVEKKNPSDLCVDLPFNLKA